MAKNSPAAGPWTLTKDEKPNDRELCLVETKAHVIRIMTYRSDGVGMWWGGGIFQNDAILRWARVAK